MDSNTHMIASQSTTMSSSQSALLSMAVTLVIIAIVLVTRVRGRQLKTARLLVGPLILIAVGVAAVAPQLHTAELHRMDYLIASLNLLDSVVVGSIRGFTVRLYDRNGELWYRYGLITVMLWFLSIAIRVILGIVGSYNHVSELIAGNDLLFMLGLTLLCQNAVVISRVKRK